MGREKVLSIKMKNGVNRQVPLTPYPNHPGKAFEVSGSLCLAPVAAPKWPHHIDLVGTARGLVNSR